MTTLPPMEVSECVSVCVCACVSLCVSCPGTASPLADRWMTTLHLTEVGECVCVYLRVSAWAVLHVSLCLSDSAVSFLSPLHTLSSPTQKHSL
jgi:hypothetical protein